VQESARRVLAFKKKSLFVSKSKAVQRAPTAAQVEKLSRQLWEFGEEIRMATLGCEDRA
jgi:hypothetical protein